MVAELVHEHVGRERVVGGDRGIEVVDAAAPVLAAVHHDLHELVGCRGRDLAPALVEDEHVPLRPEGVVGGAEGGSVMDAFRGPGHAAHVRGGVDGPHIEVGAPLLEGRLLEERLREAPGVRVPLVHLRRGVAVAEEQEVHLVARGSALLHGPHPGSRGRARSLDRGRLRVDDHREDLPEGLPPIPLLEDDLDRRRGLRETQRLGEGAPYLLRLVGRLPFSVHARETPGVEQPIRAPVSNLEEVLAEVRLVHPAVERTGPGALDHDPRERERLPGRVPGVDVLDPHRAERAAAGEALGRRPGCRAQNGETEGRKDRRQESRHRGRILDGEAAPRKRGRVGLRPR